MSKTRGFSLIELLIVVAIILTIAAIAIPTLLRSRIATNEAAAVASIRTIATAETAYAQAFPTVGYTCDLSELGPPPGGGSFSSAGGGFIDDVLASGKKSGYQMSLSNCGDPVRPTYSSAAVPLTPGSSGVKAFCSDASGVIWYAVDSTEATCRSAGSVLR
jgi:prepilin-type N-terminal cleavage/methylation domain-containing protein